MRFNYHTPGTSFYARVFSLQNELCHCKWTHRRRMLELKLLIVVMRASFMGKTNFRTLVHHFFRLCLSLIVYDYLSQPGY